MDPKADYGPLNGLARQRINIPRTARNWDDLLRVYEAWGKPDQATAWKAKVGMPDLPADVFAAP
jgi:hypothetical protein